MAMSNRELQEAALEEAKKLNKSIIDLGDDTKALTKYGHRNRLLIRLLTVSFIFDLILSMALSIVVLRANDTANKASNTATQLQTTKSSQYETCLSSNKARATNIGLWNSVFDTIGEARLPEIPELRRQVEASFAQRDCTP